MRKCCRAALSEERDTELSTDDVYSGGSLYSVLVEGEGKEARLGRRRHLAVVQAP